MLKWMRSLVGIQSSRPSRHAPDLREPRRAPLRYPEVDGVVPEVDCGEYDPKGPVRAPLHYPEEGQRHQFRPVVRDIMTLPEMVSEWERMNTAFIEHVQHAQDKYLELQEMRTRIEERLASRNEQIEVEYQRNEELRSQIGAKRDTPPADAPSPTPVVIDNSADTSLPVPVTDARQGKGHGVNGSGGRSLSNPQ